MELPNFRQGCLNRGGELAKTGASAQGLIRLQRRNAGPLAPEDHFGPLKPGSGRFTTFLADIAQAHRACFDALHTNF